MRQFLLWLMAGLVLAGVCCMVANAVIWWRSSNRRLHGAAWWARL